jgi:hypothetical protein
MSFADIVKYGRYYYPANQRYAPTSVVICDRCKRRDIPVCIGYQDQDLCLPCAEQVSVIMKRREAIPIPEPGGSPFDRITTRMESGRFRGDTMTYMASDRFRGDTMTLMATDRFREPIDYDNVIGWKSTWNSPYEEEISEHPKLIGGSGLGSARPRIPKRTNEFTTDMARDRFGK